MKRFLREYYVLILFVLVFLTGVFRVPYFIKPGNIQNLLLSSALYGIVGIGTTFVLLTGAVDLSIGMQVAFSSILACISTAALGFWPGVFVTILAGCLTGCVNGAAINLMKVNPMIISLGSMSILRGLGLIASSGNDIVCSNSTLSGLFHHRVFGLIPLPVLLFLLLLVLGFVLLRYTRLGIGFYVIGSNPRAGHMTGIPVSRVRLAAFVLCGALAALTGLLLASRMNTGSVTLGDDMTISIISSCVIGGVSTIGGKGGLLRMSFGVLLIQTINNIMSLLAVAASAQLLITGLVLVLVLFIDRLLRSKEQEVEI